MQIKLMFVAALAMSTTAISAEPTRAASAGSPIEISASGDGIWYVRCEVERSNETTLRELNKDQPAYRDDQMRSAACHYESNKKGFTIKITGAGWTCPFKAGPAGDCSLTDSKFGSGEFRLVRSDR